MKDVHAIILAAGVGSRLRPETDRIPKCLLPVGDETFLGRLLRQYGACGVRTSVVVGYRAVEVVEYVRAMAPDARIVENRLYDRTNNMFSLGLALEAKEDTVVFGNADVVYDDTLMYDFIREAPANTIPVDVGAYLDESMKVELDSSRERIVRISKQVSREAALGNSLDVYKLTSSAAANLREIIFSRYLKNGRLNEWSELALNDLLAEVPFRPWNAGGRWWVEVDTPEDLAEARRLAVRGSQSAGSRTE